MIYQPIENTGEYTTGTVYSEEYVKGLEQEIDRLHSIIKEVREYIKFLQEHYEELRTNPVEDSYFINDMLRQMFIQSIEHYLLGIEDILDKENI